MKKYMILEEKYIVWLRRLDLNQHCKVLEACRIPINSLPHKLYLNIVNLEQNSLLVNTVSFMLFLLPIEWVKFAFPVAFNAFRNLLFFQSRV